MDTNHKIAVWLVVLTLVGFCIYVIVGWRGVSRGCSGCWAQHTGANWIVVQLDLNGYPFRCWELHDVSVVNEESSDGIWWQEEDGNLVHISGLYNRVQVRGENWDGGYRSLGITKCVCDTVRQSKAAELVTGCGRNEVRQDAGSE